jgi:hypothetical protein
MRPFLFAIAALSSLFGVDEHVAPPVTTTPPNLSSSTTSVPAFNPGGTVYTHPGIVVNQGGSFIGSDHLLNIGRNIDVITEILKPADAELPFTEASINKLIIDQFVKHNIDTHPTNAQSLPFFNMLIVVYPVEQGFVALCDGRLIESIDPKRVKLDKDTQFQAITWEKKTLLVSPKEDFGATIEKAVNDILATFFERYDYFDRLKQKLEQKNETERMR